MLFTVRSWFLCHQAQVKTWLLATLLGLSWFPLSYTSLFLGRWLAALFFHYRSAAGQPVDNLFLLCAYLTMIVLGVALYLGLVPALLGIRLDDYKAFLRSIGLIGISRFGLVSISVALVVVSILVALHVLPLFYVTQSIGPYHWRANYNWIWWVTNLQPPLVEETLFRGLIIVVLLKRFPPWFAVLWSAVLFGLPHLSFGFQTALSDAFVAGVGWAIIKLKTRSIWPGAVIHYGMNSGFYLPALVGMLIILLAVLVLLAKQWLVRLESFFDRHRKKTSLNT
ncbi:MAG: CPBP family intramembrane metalloprotease [Chloroflexota bacterium]|nr:CPBP family intramembrane metalloprotease [Chloroflexota bacterium]